MKILTAKITEIKKHPQANKLKICQVDTGSEQLQIICGASNAREGMISLLATIGSKTPKGLEIKVSNLRGIDSHGMLCSPTDLDIKNEKGIIDLPPETKLGTEFSHINSKLLSSTPWYQFKLVEQHIEEEPQRIKVIKDNFSTDLKNVISETYWDNGEYHYRHY